MYKVSSFAVILGELELYKHFCTIRCAFELILIQATFTCALLSKLRYSACQSLKVNTCLLFAKPMFKAIA